LASCPALREERGGEARLYCDGSLKELAEMLSCKLLSTVASGEY